MKRSLYLVAYDVRDPKRLRAALKAVRAFATGGQKSVHECFLTDGERRQLVRNLGEAIEPAVDQAIVLRLDPRGQIETLGVGIKPTDPPFFYVG